MRIITKTKLTLAAIVAATSVARAAEPFRPPAVPLVTFNPFLSVWSEADKLTDTVTRHWTHRAQPLVSLIRIDGTSYRLMGNDPKSIEPLPQTALHVTPTHSAYEFEGSGVHVTLTFTTAALPTELDVFSRPLSYLTWSVKSIDNRQHTVQVYDSISSLMSVNEPNEPVTWSRGTAGPLTTLKVGTQKQNVLGLAGDSVQINWGYAYLAVPTADATEAAGANDDLLKQFTENGTLPTSDDTNMPRKPQDHQPVMAAVYDLGTVGGTEVQRHAIVAYDEIKAIKFFGTPLDPYWKKGGVTTDAMLQTADSTYVDTIKKCDAFDTELMADAEKVGGEKYAEALSLAYRQSAAGCGLAVDAHGQPMFFTKENTSNGDIATVDVIFPMDPVWVLLSPTLAKATLAPLFLYAQTDRWTFPCSPHDLGTYPIAKGTDDGGEAMPVEESGNMLILCDAIAQRDGNTSFVDPYWTKLSQWADYLRQFGLDPENQLCTDDFMGHLAHNANLSVKAIVALAAYGDLCRIKGDTATAERYMALAKTDAQHWIKVATEGDHTLLAFDKPHSWSQKYNLAWDKILGLNVFPPDVAAKEVAFYKTKLQPYGLPLDSRTTKTKTDWTYWSASLATNEDDFNAILAPLYTFLNTTTMRLPFTDGYNTAELHKGDFFHARPVIGGIFIRLLDDQDTWKKWAGRDTNKVGDWVPVPEKPIVKEVVPTAKSTQITWKYTTQHPADGWQMADFVDGSWRSGVGGFGTRGTPGAINHTKWNSDDIWLRRTFTLPAGVDRSKLQLYLHHDDDVEVYLNGVEAANLPDAFNSYQPVPIEEPAMLALRDGKNVMAIHCHQRGGGQYIDCGLVTVTAVVKK